MLKSQRQMDLIRAMRNELFEVGLITRGEHTELSTDNFRVIKSLIDYDEILVTLETFKTWVKDLQSGMYINCVYCGHRYGPKDKIPVSMAAVLKKHIELCPEHPMSKLKTKIDNIGKVVDDYSGLAVTHPHISGWL